MDDKVNLFCKDEDGRTIKQFISENQKACLNSNIGLNFFTWRFINYWKQLTDEVVCFKSLSAFKIILDEFMTAKGKFKFIVVHLINA